MADFDIVVNKTHQWGPEDLALGTLNGSEEMVVNLARSIRHLGHNVTVACTLKGVSRMVDGVSYVSRHYYERDLMPRNGVVLIAFKSQDMLDRGGYRARYLWTADPVVLTSVQRMGCTAMYAISDWHYRELVRLNDGFERIGHIEPGFTPLVGSDGPIKRVKGQCLYASSHDRGLYDLFQMWPSIRSQVPMANLIVTYDDPNPQIMPPEHVYYVGRLSDKAMTDLYRSSDVLLYPCTGGERFCLTVLKAQYYGCIPITTDVMALKTTNQTGICCKKQKFVDTAASLLQDPTRKAEMRENPTQRLRFSTWEDVAFQWEDIALGEGAPSR